jgi:catalase
LFWNSQSAAEKEHLVAAFQFELSRIETTGIRQRVVDNLAHVDPKLARKVAEPLGIAAPDAKAAAGRAGFREYRIKQELEASAALGMEGSGGGIHTRRVAVLVAEGVEMGALKALQHALADQGATTRIIAAHLGFVATSSGQQMAVDHTFATMPSVMFDAVLVPGGASSAEALLRHARRCITCSKRTNTARRSASLAKRPSACPCWGCRRRPRALPAWWWARTTRPFGRN